MKRLCVLGFVLCAVLASRDATHAQTSATTTPTATSTASPAPTATAGATATPTATPPPVQLLNPAAFALSAWYFPPPAAIVTSQVESNDMAVANTLIPHLGTQSFAAEGRVNGYFVDSSVRNRDDSGVDHPVFTHYFVSMFPSVAQAASAFVQERTGWDRAINDPTSTINGQLVPVSAHVGDEMSAGIYEVQASSSSGTSVLFELLFQRGPYLIEVWQTMLQKDVAKYAATARPYLLSLAQALDTVASGQKLPALPKPAVKIHMQRVRFEANNTKEGFTNTPLTSVKAGSKVQLGAYFVLISAPPGSQVKSDFWLTMGKRKLHKVYRHKLGSYPPDYFHEYVYNVLVPRAGKYQLKVQLSIGKVSTSGTAALSVTK